MTKDETDGFLLDLEKVAKSLSMGNDRSSMATLKQLFEDLQVEARPRIEAILPGIDEKPA